MTMIATYALIIVLLPLLAFVIQLFFGKRLPRQGDWLPTTAMFVGLLLSLIIAGQVFSRYDPGFRVAKQFEWIIIGTTTIKFGILIDNLTAAMLFIVTLISSLVHLFSIGYMHDDPRYSRYFAYLSLFSFSMLGLVTIDNFLGIYMFWELVGLSSYLLIGFWFEKKSASDAAKKAFLTNRVGDVGMFIGILLIFATLKTFNFDEVFSAIAKGELSGGVLTLAGLLIFCGAVGKSAQFPLHVWLPDAMEGPTPVSALIHAATMVAAGVYLVGRTFLLYTETALTVIAVIGTVTAFMAATIALVQVDIKRVLAYSTISQLGYMIAALGMGGYNAGLFHLMTHAYFKALLFLGAGAVIHAMHHEQDMRQMGGLRKKLPVTFFTMLIATMAISGVPGLSGFFSKDAILAASLEKAMETGSALFYTLFMVLLFTAALTAFYMFRMIFLTFYGEPRNKEKYSHAHEAPATMTIPLVALAIFTVIGGWGHWFQDLIQKPSLVQFAGMPAAEAAEHAQAASVSGAHTVVMILSILFAAAGILGAMLFYYWNTYSPQKVSKAFSSVYTFLWHKWYFDELYRSTVVLGTLALSKASRWFDNNVIDNIVNGTAKGTTLFSFGTGSTDNRVVDGLVNWVARVIGWFGDTLREVQTGRVQAYILMALGAFILLYVIQLAMI